MSNDLVKRLRSYAPGTMDEAADRIEELEYKDKDWLRICDRYADRIEQLEHGLVLISGFNEHNHPCKHEIDEVISNLLGGKR